MFVVMDGLDDKAVITGKVEERPRLARAPEFRENIF